MKLGKRVTEKLVLFVFALVLAGCSKDSNPTESQQKTLEGAWNIHIHTSKDTDGILAINSTTQTQFSAIISFTGAGQMNITGTYTSTQIHFPFRSNQTTYFATWVLDGTYNLDNGKMIGTFSVYNETTQEEIIKGGAWEADK